MLHLSLARWPWESSSPPPLHLTPPSSDHLTTLPQELIDHILDYLHASPQSLRACALASRALLSGSQHHLFHTLTLACAADAHNLTYLLPSAPGALAHVHELRVRLARAPWSDAPDPAWFTALDLPLLVGLHTLRLEGVRGAALCGPQLCGWARAGKTLSSLELAGCVFGAVSELRGLLAALPRLDALSFDGWLPAPPEVDEDLEPPEDLRLRRLVLPAAGTRGTQHLLQWLASGANAKPRLRALHTLTLHGTPDSSVIDPFFAATAVQELRVVLAGQFPGACTLPTI